ncbi:multidrug effflux MFS transporter [Verticiella sediminum]|uniref:Bcr/CflA family efflux transporter n=1 Tax=Verticiella sediminum TaxID=1247510 RepID=A0A556B174_9BURK|nr:multidrug effflux MFS transporter [Verticiella sediminum]TSH98941.1 multidrug effflux MFS transporter [Verticiella sediminum]
MSGPVRPPEGAAPSLGEDVAQRQVGAPTSGPARPPEGAAPSLGEDVAQRQAGTPTSAPARPRGVLPTLAASAALATFASSIILPALPAMAQAFGVSDAAMNAALSVFLLVFALAQLVAGPLADRVGRRPVILAGLCAFLAGSLVCATADSLAVLLVGRALQACGAAATAVLARAAARDLFEGAMLTRLLGLIMVVMAAAPGFSPLAGGVLAQGLGWRSAFYVVALYCLLLAWLYPRFVGETLPPARRRQLGPGPVVAGYATLLRDGRFVRPALAGALVYAGLFALFGSAPLILIQEYGHTVLQVGLFFAATVFVVFGAGTLAPRLAGRTGAPATLAVGLALTLLAGAALVAWTAPPFAAYVAAVCIFLFGMGLVSPVATAMALGPFGDRAGLASALLGFVQMASAAAGTALATSLALPRTQALGAVFAAAALLALGCHRRRPRAAPAAS